MGSHFTENSQKGLLEEKRKMLNSNDSNDVHTQSMEKEEERLKDQGPESEGQSESDTCTTVPPRRGSAWKTFKRKASVIPKGANPLNWKMIALVFISLFCSAVSLTFLFPFLPEMILWFGYKEEDKGYYAGLVASGVFAGRAVGSYFWGWLSDKWGRRPVMIITIFGNGFFSLLFGFTYNLPMAIITRFLTGLANGTVGTVKTVLYEISDNTNQAAGMSFIGIAWGGGIIIGPTVGGMLASPTRHYPEVFDENGLFGQFPYLLPSLVIFIVCTSVCILDFFLLPETNKSRTRNIEIKVEENTEDEKDHLTTDQDDQAILDKDDCKVLVDTDPNLYTAPKIAMSVEDLHCESEAASYKVQLEQQRSYHSNQNLSSSSKDDVETFLLENKGQTEALSSISKPSHVHEENNSNHNSGVKGQKTEVNGVVQDESDSVRKMSCWEKMCNSSLIKLFRMSDVRKAVFLYSAYSFGVIGYEEIFTVWASTKPRFDGLDFDPHKIGVMLGISGVPLLVVNVYLFPAVVKRVGLKRTYVIFSTLLCITVTVTPVLHLVYDNEPLLLSLIVLVMIPQKLMTACCFSATSIFVNNSTPPNFAGQVNGIAMTATAIARSIAPAFGGSIFAWSIGYGAEHIGPPFDVNLAFFVFGLVVWATTIYGIFLPEKLTQQKK